MRLRQIVAFSLISLSALLLPAAAYADWQVEVYGGVAGLSTELGNQVFPLPPPSDPQINTLQNPSTTSAEFAPGFGISYDFPTRYATELAGGGYILNDISLGVNAYYLGGSRSGQVYKFSDPDLVANDYNTSLNSWQVMLDSEFDFHPLFANVMPFFEFGLGDAINTMSYGEVQDPNHTAFAIPVNMQTETTNNFAYQVGGGLKWPVTHYGTLSLRYLYTDMGEAEASQLVSGSHSAAVNPMTADMHSSSLLVGFNYGLGGIF